MQARDFADDQQARRIEAGCNDFTLERCQRPRDDPLRGAGALLYMLLTERSPYDFPERLEQKIMKILLDDPVPIRTRRPDLPEELAAVIDRALARKPQARFATVKEMGRALNPFVR